MHRIVNGSVRGKSLLSLALIVFATIALTTLSTIYMNHRDRGPLVSAASKGLDGPDIELLENANKAYERIVGTTAAAIVYIRTEQVVRAQDSPLLMDPTLRQFFGQGGPQIPREQRQHALGTGVVFDPNGYIVTNNHVIDRANSVEIMLSDKRIFKAKVIGADPDIDIAVVKIDSGNVPTVPLGDSSTLHVGDIVMAFGNPFGLNFTVTRGTVSALGRSQGNIEALQDFIQTDAAINPGNSGGALVDVTGQVVGINTAILSPNAGMGGEGGSVGIGFAIPINMAKHAIDSLIKTGKVTRGYLGVTIGPVTEELAQQFRVPDTAGALIQDVTPGGPADKAGLKPGDIIRKFNGRTVRESTDLLAMAAGTNPGTPATLEVMRNGETLTKQVTLEPRPSELSYAAGAKRPPAEGALRGITVQNLTEAIRRQLGISANVHGVVVTGVDPQSPAAQQIEEGDVIMSINHQDINSVSDFNKLAAQAKGSTLLRIIHRGQPIFVVIPEDNANQ